MKFWQLVDDGIVLFGLVVALTAAVVALLMNGGCSTYHARMNTIRGSGTVESTNFAGVFVNTREDFNNADARNACVAGYNQQRAQNAGTVPNTFGTCTNDVGYGMPHPTMPAWGFGWGGYTGAAGFTGMSTGAPVRW